MNRKSGKLHYSYKDELGDEKFNSVTKFKGKKQLVKHKHRWKNKLNPKERGFKGTNCIQLAQNRTQ
jgi:hypothetical protein